jgi:hypothetical protein
MLRLSLQLRAIIAQLRLARTRTVLGLRQAITVVDNIGERDDLTRRTGP